MPEEMFFIIADISGYTAFMVRNEMEHTHGILVINALMKALVKEVDLPLEIAKLEGDAIFLFLYAKHLPESMLAERILKFFTTFEHQLISLQGSTACDCGACSNIGQLNLKIVAHFGKAEVVEIGSFKELSGVDVILAHRLLKNQVKEKRYLLMTKPAYERLSLPPNAMIAHAEEFDKDIGTIPIVVYYPLQLSSIPKPKKLSAFQKLKSHLQLALGAFMLKFSQAAGRKYRNLPR